MIVFIGCDEDRMTHLMLVSDKMDSELQNKILKNFVQHH
jgi:hypothetical protein